MALGAAAAICVGGAFHSKAQPAPPNDNLTNAQVILGPSGSVQGTNINATIEGGRARPGAGGSGPIHHLVRLDGADLYRD
jgi:hypothetical protein